MMRIATLIYFHRCTFIPAFLNRRKKLKSLKFRKTFVKKETCRERERKKRGGESLKFKGVIGYGMKEGRVINQIKGEGAIMRMWRVLNRKEGGCI